MLLPLLALFFLSRSLRAELPEVSRTTPEIVRYYKYPAEIHNATTSDGYILELHRIPCGLKSPCKAGVKRPVIFLQHGLLASSADWILNTPDESSGFIFADAGYDVWMGNVRGNRYSRRHTKHSVDSTEFWEFSFDHHAYYDLPAMLNYVLEKTGQEYLYYLGHSQGTLIAFIQFSRDPELASRVRVFFGFAPVVSTERLKGLFRDISNIVNGAKGFIDDVTHWLSNLAGNILAEVGSWFTGKKERVNIELDAFRLAFFTLLGRREFLPSKEASQKLMKWFCTLSVFFKINCESIFLLVSGDNTKYSNLARQEAFLAHYPSGTSSRNILHWLQFVKQNWLPRKFDYENAEDNKLAYGQASPPEHNLTTLRTDCKFWASFHDLLANPADLHQIFRRVRGLRMHTKAVKEINHLDFLYGAPAKEFSLEIIQEIDTREKTKYERACYAQGRQATGVDCSKVLAAPDAKPTFDMKSNVKAQWIWPTTKAPPKH